MQIRYFARERLNRLPVLENYYRNVSCFFILRSKPSIYIQVEKFYSHIHICIYLCYENVDYRCNPREYRDPTIKCECNEGVKRRVTRASRGKKKAKARTRAISWSWKPPRPVHIAMEIRETMDPPSWKQHANISLFFVDVTPAIRRKDWWWTRSPRERSGKRFWIYTYIYIYINLRRERRGSSGSNSRADLSGCARN